MILKITWKRALTAAGALSAVSLAIAWSGVINIGASTGHWAITDWFLHWAMRNSVRTQAALTVDEPAIDQTNLVSAAGHYAATCALCHGAPGKPPLPVMQASTPAPPDLAETVNTWSDQQLFWIIKHGVKFTPMPAWPALGRDDEIRRMAAFVRRLPDMTAEEYREFAYGSEHI
ncbi:MAG: cytochrome c, partial [Nitrosomonas sp.]|nr:cytochrome c [Nitrosomonas sp.]